MALVSPSCWGVAIEPLLEPFPEPDAVLPVTTDDLYVIDEGLWTEAASRRRQRIERAPQSVEIIDADDLRRLPGGSLPEALRYYPGVEVSQARHGQFDVGLRGYTGVAHPRTLTLVDGRSVQAAPIGTVYWVGRFGQSEIDRVEVVKGPASVTYGANAFGGVVAIRTRRVGEEAEFHQWAGAGTDGYAEADATVLIPLSKSGFYLKTTAGMSRRNDLPGRRGNEATTATSLSAATGDDDLDAWRAGMVLGFHATETIDIELDGRIFDIDPWEFIEDFSAGSNAADGRIESLGARVRGDWFELDYQREWTDLDYQNQRATFSPAFQFQFNQVAFDDVGDNLRGQVNVEVGEHVLTAGAQYTRVESTSNLWARDGVYADPATWETEVTTNRAAFVEGQLQLDNAWTLTAGARVDDHSLVGSDVSPRAAVNYTIEPGHFMRLSMSTGYRLPTAIESYISEFFFEVDPDLEAEDITSFELAWQKHTGEWSLGIGGFYNRSNNQLWRDPLDSSTMEANYNSWLAAFLAGDNQRRPGPFFNLTNLDNPVIGFGLEVFGEWRASNEWSVWANATLQRYRFEDEIPFSSDGFTTLDLTTFTPVTVFQWDETLPDDINTPSDWKANLGVTWSPGDWSLTLAGRVVGPRTVFSFPGSFFQSSGDIAVEELDAYAALDASVVYMLSAGPGHEAWLRASVTDIFDSQHDEVFGYPEATLIADDTGQYGSYVGRHLVIGFGASF